MLACSNADEKSSWLDVKTMNSERRAVKCNEDNLGNGILSHHEGRVY